MKVQVERVLYDSPDTGFHICKAAVLEATQEDMIPKPLLGSLETLTIKGYFPINKIVNLLVKGSWEKSKYGYALVVIDSGADHAGLTRPCTASRSRWRRKSSVSSGFKRLRYLKTAPNSS